MSRSRDQVIWDFVQEWWAKADGDLRAAEHLLTLPQEDYFAAAFHAQQAAEQFSQAFLVRHQALFRKPTTFKSCWISLRSSGRI